MTFHFPLSPFAAVPVSSAPPPLALLITTTSCEDVELTSIVPISPLTGLSTNTKTIEREKHALVRWCWISTFNLTVDTWATFLPKMNRQIHFAKSKRDLYLAVKCAHDNVKNKWKVPIWHVFVSFSYASWNVQGQIAKMKIMNDNNGAQNA